MVEGQWVPPCTPRSCSEEMRLEWQVPQQLEPYSRALHWRRSPTKGKPRLLQNPKSQCAAVWGNQQTHSNLGFPSTPRSLNCSLPTKMLYEFFPRIIHRPPNSSYFTRSPKRPCYCSGCSSPASNRGGPDLSPGQDMWDFWWTKWHWGRFPPSKLVFSANFHSTDCSTFIIIIYLSLVQ
jgi:hypothetical protein